MWKPEHRRAAARSGLRYPSDLSDAEWAIVEPMIPPARHGGRKRSVNVREVLNGIFYVLWTGCQWKALPKDLPPKSTVHDYLELWNWDGTLERIHHALYVELRERDGREASPTTAIIDSQSAKGAQKGGLCSILQATTRGKKIKGRKRHILVDTLGILLGCRPCRRHPGSRRRGSLARHAHALFPFIERIFADARYQAKKTAPSVAATGCWVCRSSSEPMQSRRRHAQTMDRRANACLDQSKPPPRLPTRQNRRHLRSPRHDPHHA